MSANKDLAVDVFVKLHGAEKRVEKLKKELQARVARLNQEEFAAYYQETNEYVERTDQG